MENNLPKYFYTLYDTNDSYERYRLFYCSDGNENADKLGIPLEVSHSDRELWHRTNMLADNMQKTLSEYMIIINGYTDCDVAEFAHIKTNPTKLLVAAGIDDKDIPEMRKASGSGYHVVAPEVSYQYASIMHYVGQLWGWFAETLCAQRRCDDGITISDVTEHDMNEREIPVSKALDMFRSEPLFKSTMSLIYDGVPLSDIIA